jgi:predicted DNA-binding helix-hairpin-helix protein
VIRRVGFLVDRMSVNLELPTAEGLRNLALIRTERTYWLQSDRFRVVFAITRTN